MKEGGAGKRILIASIHFTPELTGIGVYSGELAEWLASNGYQVHVVCASPFYPAWRPLAGFRNRYRRSSKDGLTVLRSPLYIPTKLSAARRMLHLFSFALTSLPLLLSQIVWQPAIVISVVPTYAVAPIAWLVARLCGAKCIVHVQDFEVDAAFRITGAPSGLLQRIVLRLESWLLRRFDLVSTISKKMRSGLIDKGAIADRTILFRNWVDLDRIYPLPDTGAARADFGIPQEAIVCLYSGNMGRKQGIETLAEVALKLQHRSDILFMFCGDGEMRKMLEQETIGLPNVRFLPLQPVERLNSLLNCADIHLLPQRRAAADLVLPSKLGGILASARPVVAGADAGTELAEMVADCGLVVPPEDPEAFADAVTRLANNPELRGRLGQSGRIRAEEQLSKRSIIAGFVNTIIGAESESSTTTQP